MIVDDLLAVLGKRFDAPEVLALCATHGLPAPKPTTDAKDEVVATGTGFELYFSHRVARRGFLPPEKLGRGYVAYCTRILVEPTLPLPFGFRGDSRESIVAALGEPYLVNTLGNEMFKREVAPGIVMTTSYKPEKQKLGHVWLQLETGSELHVNPLAFETAPPEGKPAHADQLAAGLLVAWLADRIGLVPELAGTARAKQLAARAITGREFLQHELAGRLITLDVPAEARSFLHSYVHRVWPKGVRDSAISFTPDFLATFAGAVSSPYLVPDAWAAFDRLAPILDARWADYRATGFVGDPPAGVYEAAATARDAIAIENTTPVAQAVAATAETTAQLQSIVGKVTTDKAVKAILTALELPVGKTIDMQARGALGVSYMATRPSDKSKMPEGAAKKAVVIDYVSFHAGGTEEYVRGLGMKVQYLAYQGPLPYGVTFGMTREQARAAVGSPPKDAYDHGDWWALDDQQRRFTVFYDAGIVTRVTWGMPHKWGN